MEDILRGALAWLLLFLLVFFFEWLLFGGPLVW